MCVIIFLVLDWIRTELYAAALLWMQSTAARTMNEAVETGRQEGRW